MKRLLIIFLMSMGTLLCGNAYAQRIPMAWTAGYFFF